MFNTKSITLVKKSKTKNIINVIFIMFAIFLIGLRLFLLSHKKTSDNELMNTYTKGVKIINGGIIQRGRHNDKQMFATMIPVNLYGLLTHSFIRVFIFFSYTIYILHYTAKRKIDYSEKLADEKNKIKPSRHDN